MEINRVPNNGYEALDGSSGDEGFEPRPSGITLREALAILRRRWPIVAGVFAIVVAIGAWRTWREQRVYQEVAQRRRFGNFRLPLVVELVRKNGTVTRATVEVPAQSESRLLVPIDLDAPPARVNLDPDASLLAAISPPRRQR